MVKKMNILLFGISNVGKTTTGKLVAEKLGYDFYDLDEEIRNLFGMTQQDFIDTFRSLNTRDRIRGEVIGNLLELDGSKVIAITPMYYSDYFNRYLDDSQALGIELQDTPENIFDRLVFTDDNDQIYEDSAEYREKHKAYYLEEIKEDIAFYRESFAKIDNKFQMKNDPPEIAADRLIREYRLADVAERN